jgi:hypothetical protein
MGTLALEAAAVCTRLQSPAIVLLEHEFICNRLKQLPCMMAAVANSGGGTVILGIQLQSKATCAVVGLPTVFANCEQAQENVIRLISDVKALPAFEMNGGAWADANKIYYWCVAVPAATGRYCIVVTVSRAHVPVLLVPAFGRSSTADVSNAIAIITNSAPVSWYCHDAPAVTLQTADLQHFKGSTEGSPYSTNHAVDWMHQEELWKDPISYVQTQVQALTAELLRSGRRSSLTFGVDADTLLPQPLLCTDVDKLKQQLCNALRERVSAGVFPAPSLRHARVVITQLNTPAVSALVPHEGGVLALRFDSHTVFTTFVKANTSMITALQLLFVPILPENFIPLSSDDMLPPLTHGYAMLLCSHGVATPVTAFPSVAVTRGVQIECMSGSDATEALTRAITQVTVTITWEVPHGGDIAAWSKVVNPAWFAQAAPVIDSTSKSMRALSFWEVWRAMRGGPSWRSLRDRSAAWLCLSLDPQNAIVASTLRDSGIAWSGVLDAASVTNPFHAPPTVPIVCVIDVGALDDSAIVSKYEQMALVLFSSHEGARLSILLIGPPTVCVTAAQRLACRHRDVVIHVLTPNEVDVPTVLGPKWLPPEASCVLPAPVALPASGGWESWPPLVPASGDTGAAYVQQTSDAIQPAIEAFLCGTAPLSLELASLPIRPDYWRDECQVLLDRAEAAIAELRLRELGTRPQVLKARGGLGAGVRTVVSRALFELLRLQPGGPTLVYFPIVSATVAALDSLCFSASSSASSNVVCVAGVQGELPHTWKCPANLRLVLIEVSSAEDRVTSSPTECVQISTWLSAKEFEDALLVMTNHCAGDSAWLGAITSLRAAADVDRLNPWSITRTVMAVDLTIRAGRFEPVDILIHRTLRGCVLAAAVMETFTPRRPTAGSEYNLSTMWRSLTPEADAARISHAISCAGHLSRTPVFTHLLLAQLFIAYAATNQAAGDDVSRLLGILHEAVSYLVKIRDERAIRTLLIGRAHHESFSPLASDLLAMHCGSQLEALVRSVLTGTVPVSLALAARSHVFLARLAWKTVQSADQADNACVLRAECLVVYRGNRGRTLSRF